MSLGLTILAIAGIVGSVSAYLVSQKPGPGPIATGRTIPIGDRPQKLWQQWRYRNGNSRLARVREGMRSVPVVAMTNFRLATGDPHRSKQDMINILTALKAYLTQAGRGDEDVRCVYALYVKESGYRLGSIWNYNFGNHKAFGIAGSEATLTAGIPHVFTSNPNVSGIWIAQGRHENASEPYWAFESPAHWFRHEREWFVRNGYDGVLAGYRQGGLAGLLAADVAFATKGYSYATVAGRQASSRAYWRHLERMFTPSELEGLR